MNRPRTADSDARVAPDAQMESLQRVLGGQQPVALEANLAREIRRALAMAKEFKLDPIITGSLEADEAIAELNAQHARVIYSLNFPQRPKSLAPDADEPLRVLRQRANAPKVPAALEKGGVLFAFASAGEEPDVFLKNARQAVKAGLSAEAALKALTINAAIIAGVADRLGSLEKGKIANLVVTDGDLFDEKTRVVFVFIEGEPVLLESDAKR